MSDNKLANEARRERLAADGRCVDCAEHAHPGRTLCAPCLETKRTKMRVRIGYQGRKRCGVCRELGHQRQNCARSA